MIKLSAFHRRPPTLQQIAVWIGVVFILSVATLQHATRHSQAASHAQRQLTFEERVAYQRAIEAVYWRHRLWPKENPLPKPALDEVMPESVIRAKVEDYLRQSNALEQYWQRPITAEQLQAEMERMAHQTKQPEVLRELWAALNNDPFIIAECLARPELTSRLLHNWYASDERFHGELKRRAEAELNAPGAAGRLSHLSGEYRETEWRLTSDEQQPDASNPQPVHSLNADQWREQISKLAQMFGDVPSDVQTSAFKRNTHSTNAPLEDGKLNFLGQGKLRLGQVSVLQEEEERFYALMVLEQSAESVKVASVEWRKTPFAEWWSSVKSEFGSDASVSGIEFKLPMIEAASASCVSETWSPTFQAAPGLPSRRGSHTAVWTGSEMIIWGGNGESGIPNSSVMNTGGRYNPATNSWTATNVTGAPSARRYHTAVWTGSEMIVWGGADSSSATTYFNTGGRYNPATNSWIATSTTGAPSPREDHITVWTGSEMIVWGGDNASALNPSSSFNTGGRYNPTANTWTATSTTSAPSARVYHTAVWIGSEMIVWGGSSSLTGNGPQNTGGRYNPVTNTWAATNTTSSPSKRIGHAAVWTGSEMIVWGGFDPSSSSNRLNTGGRYNPATDTWTATNTTDAPTQASHTAIWTGSEMIIWGGTSSSIVNTGGRYNPLTDSWTATSAIGAPSPRIFHTAVWTGSEMIVWGGNGLLDTGGRYNPATDAWLPTSNITSAPSKRFYHTAAWTGSEMIVWGGSNGSNPLFDGILSTGGRYNPAIDTWTDTSTTTAPSARAYHTAVWTGNEMIIWGGNAGLNTGGRYNPVTDTWTASNTTGAPAPRAYHTAVWTGSQMIIWGGRISDSFDNVVNTGGRYNPMTDAWTDTNTNGAPRVRSTHTAVWTGSEMIVWGGRDDDRNFLNTGGRYNPGMNVWTTTTTIGAPSPRGLSRFSTVWTGSEMIVWGGYNGFSYLNSGGRYNPVTNTWTATSMTK